jgi:DNA-binding response OmpR family regulator
MRILLIDDDTRLRQVLARLLRARGFDSIDEAGDGQEAMEMLPCLAVDLIFANCLLPRMDGISLVRALRARGDQTPVIMLRGQAEAHMVVMAVMAGANGCLPRVIHPDLLLEKIGQALLFPLPGPPARGEKRFLMEIPKCPH